MNIIGFRVFNHEGDYIGIVKNVIKSKTYENILNIKSDDKEVIIPVLYSQRLYVNYIQRKLFIIFHEEYSHSIYIDNNCNDYIVNYYYYLYEN
jgi:ribosomal 30S subunit maturation factor RimM